MKTGPNQIYEFGPYRLNVGECKLWRDGEEARLRPKVFDLLCLLVERHGQMIEKEDLIKELWPDSSVEENNLTVTVNALRAALGDDEYIETVPKRGYRFTAEVKISYGTSATLAFVAGLPQLPEPPGGAVPLESHLYILRPADDEFCKAIARHDSIVLVKGARQVGKTSLLARGLQEARNQGAAVLLIDFQQFSSMEFETVEKLLLAIAELIAYQLELSPAPHKVWNSYLGPSSNFERYIRSEVFAKTTSYLVWGLDEVDRLFNFDYASEIFGLFRSWHNLRALDPQGPWHRLTLAIAYATEAHLFITDLNQSPFNVGTRVTLEDFTLEQLMRLNHRYQSPLRNEAEASRLHNLLGGHPYLTQRGLYEMVRNRVGLEAIEEQAEMDEGAFGDHLKRMLVSVEQDHDLREELRGFLQTGSGLSNHTFSRLRSAGILSGNWPREPKLRCELYAAYLKRHLI
ncbi:MAG TPA: AAA-like domain-containing protein [Blastocatellia bacterium]|jgi:DNA-binding winged helix-turn-helix (wHTH) protein|nr:AAA-like domain-containing protein [Blastocatellia bacterium]